MTTKHDGMAASYRDDWCTPVWVVAMAQKVAGEEQGWKVYFDPCSNPRSSVGAMQSFERSRGEDGVLLKWPNPGRGLVFVNPPWGRQVRSWAEKIVLEAGRGHEIVALLPAHVGSMWWWSNIVPHANEIAYFRHRIDFDAPDGAQSSNNPYDCAAAYFGPRVDVFRRVFSEHCWLASNVGKRAA